jgi:hypothetical protein
VRKLATSVSIFSQSSPHSSRRPQFKVHLAMFGNLRLSNQAHRAVGPIWPSGVHQNDPPSLLPTTRVQAAFGSTRSNLVLASGV